MKTFVLTVSRTFPATHKRKGEETFFLQKIMSALGFEIYWDNFRKNMDQMKILVPVVSEFDRKAKKIHTIRSNYELWKKRIDQVTEGKAILSIRYWSGKPYNSKQVEICQLDKDSGIGVQELFFKLASLHLPTVDTNSSGIYGVPSLERLAKNDGLSLDDFKEWFKNYDLSKSMAIIHFTSLRY